jgi:hypothetical protein
VPRHGRLAPGKETQYSYRRLTSGPVCRDMKILAATGIRSPDRPARSESQYRLPYPGPQGV